MKAQSNNPLPASPLETVDKLLRLIDREVWILTAAVGERRGGLLATWVSVASIDPQRPVLLAGIAPNHFTAELVQQSGRFVAHLLQPAQAALAWNFANGSGRDRDKFAGLATKNTPGNAPQLMDCLAWFDCRVFSRYDAGDRLFFWADVVVAGESGQGAPLREQEFIRSLTDEQRKSLLVSRSADVAWQQPQHEAWRSSLKSQQVSQPQ